MNYKFHLSVVTGAIMIAVLVTLVAPHFTGAVGPTRDAPDNGSLSPTFSGLTVNGGTDLNGNLDVSGNITDSNSNVTIADGLTVTGTSTLKAANLTGNLSVTGNVSLTGVLSDSNSTSLTISDGLIVTGDTTISGALDSKDTLKNSLVSEYACNCYFNGYRWVCSVCTSPNPVSVDDNLDVNGKITATSIGTVTVRHANTNMPAGQLVNAVTAYCNPGEIRIGCGGGFNAGLAARLDSITPSYGWGQACVVAANNSAGGSSTLDAYSICLATGS